MLDISSTQLYRCVVIPPFDQSSGNLPPGVHWAEWEEIEIRFGHNAYRRNLLSGFRMAIELLRKAGCVTVFLDGSFVSAVDQPCDFDACWDVTGVNTNHLDSVFLQFDYKRAAQKARFFGELFPAQLPNGTVGGTFLELFQVDKNNGDPKGIIAIDLRRLR